MTTKNIGPYQVASTVGQGAYGAVYDATHEETGQRVALKLLHGTKSLEPEVQNRFVREIAILQRLDNENIVRHFDCGLHDGDIYCAMELVDSGSLKEVLVANGSLPWRESAEVALQVCQALTHAHENDCVHRDLKPANLYLSSDGKVKLGDLGLARDLGDNRLTIQGQTVGTWRYMAPEQITAEDDIDGRLDIYALGCILFEMIVGHVPFDGPDFVTIFDQHLETPAERVDTVLPEVPKPLADLIATMLEKSPEDRPADANQVGEQLEKILSGESTELAEPTATNSVNSEEPEPEKNLTDRLRSAPQLEPRNVNTKAIFVACAVIAAIVIAVTVLR